MLPRPPLSSSLGLLQVDDLRRQVLSLRAQLAASEEARVDAWTKLQAVYSGDQVTPTRRQAPLDALLVTSV